MNVACSHCRTVFRVDPGKVPADGVRARCSICRGVFRVDAPGSSVASAGPLLANGSAFGQPAAAASVAAPPISQAPAAQTPEPAAAAPVTASREPLTPQPAAAGSPRFGGQDPQSKARRLARALVSDMVTYHPERQERGLREGTLRKEFKEEIRKSWEEFVEQVGRQTAHETPYFRDALNEILARGQKVF